MKGSQAPVTPASGIDTVFWPPWPTYVWYTQTKIKADLFLLNFTFSDPLSGPDKYWALLGSIYSHQLGRWCIRSGDRGWGASSETEGKEAGPGDSPPAYPSQGKLEEVTLWGF